MDRAVMTVLGPVAPALLGHVQMHEHLFCDLGAYAVDDDKDDEITLENLYRVRASSHKLDMRLDSVDDAVVELRDFKSAGGGTVVDATPDGLGRDPAKLVEAARTSGVQVVMGCGYYTEAFHPDALPTATVDALAQAMIHDLDVGAGVSGVRAGIIGEIGLSWPPTGMETSVLRGAVIAQQQTGAALLLHPGRAAEAPADHLQSVIEAGGDPERVVVSHVDRTLFALDDMLRLAGTTGCVLEFDLFGDESSYYALNSNVDRPNDGMRVGVIKALLDRGLGGQIVISQDICRKTRLQRWGGEGYAHLLRRVLPLMQARGISAQDIVTMTRTRPAELLSRAVAVPPPST